MDNEECLNSKITQLGFTRMESPDNGDCFFLSLETYFKVKETPLSEKDAMELRTDLVTYLLANLDKYRDYSGIEGKGRTAAARKAYIDRVMTREINKLSGAGVYDTDLGDIVPQAATNAFNVRIIVHNWRWATMDFANFVLGPDDGAPDYTIHLLRINENHFDLLFPTIELKEDEQGRWNMIQVMRAPNSNNNNNNNNGSKGSFNWNKWAEKSNNSNNNENDENNNNNNDENEEEAEEEINANNNNGNSNNGNSNNGNSNNGNNKNGNSKASSTSNKSGGRRKTRRAPKRKGTRRV